MRSGTISAHDTQGGRVWLYARERICIQIVAVSITLFAIELTYQNAWQHIFAQPTQQVGH
jgi:hypothetical protein